MQENPQYTNQNERKGYGHAWFIAGIAILALILAWVAFNRAGQDVLPTFAEEAEETQQQVEASVEATEAMATKAATDARIMAARAKARADLFALQAELEAGATYDEVEQDLNEVEANLESAYANTSDELQTEYQTIQQELELLGDSIQDGTGDALEMLANLSLKLESEVRTDD